MQCCQKKHLLQQTFQQSNLQDNDHHWSKDLIHAQSTVPRTRSISLVNAFKTLRAGIAGDRYSWFLFMLVWPLVSKSGSWSNRYREKKEISYVFPSYVIWKDGGSQVGWGVSVIRKKREEQVKGERVCVWKTQSKLLPNTLNLFSLFLLFLFWTQISLRQGIRGKKLLGYCFCFAGSSSFEFMGFSYQGDKSDHI